jgi:hypothetical protein
MTRFAVFDPDRDPKMYRAWGITGGVLPNDRENFNTPQGDGQ